MPKLWTETIEGHRQAVRDATFAATAALVEERGLAGVTMSAIAERTGIGRATLYKYFPDLEAILLAWHEQEVDRHLAHLAAVRNEHAEAGDRLRAVLEGYALARFGHEHHREPLAARLHVGGTGGPDAAIMQLVTDLIAEAARAGAVRSDIAPQELAAFAVNALGAAASLEGRPAIKRLAELILATVAPKAS